jgi:hypothetical protein
VDLYAEMQGTGKIVQRFRLDAILDELPEDEAESVMAALNDPAVLHSKIANVLCKYGHPISPNAVSNYRHKKCFQS